MTRVREALKRTDPMSPTALEDDARHIADAVVRAWGDQAPEVLARARELAAADVAAWTPAPAKASE